MLKTDYAKIAHAIERGDEFRNRIPSVVDRELTHAFRQLGQTMAQHVSHLA